MLLYIGLLILLLIIAGIYSGTETGIITLNKIKLKNKSKKGNKNATIMDKLIKNIDKLIISNLLGTNIAIVSATIVFIRLWDAYFGSFISSSFAVVIILTPISLIASEIIPKSLFLKRANTLTLRFAKWLYISYKVFLPFIWLASVITTIIMKLFGIKRAMGEIIKTPEQIITYFRLGFKDISERVRQLAEGILKMRSTLAKEIMVPLVDIVAIEKRKTVGDAIKLMIESGYSKIPVYDKRIDNLVGYLDAYDFIVAKQKTKSLRITRFIREAIFVPETKPIDEVKVEMQNASHQIAFVVDEYGSVSGMLTAEDIAEEIIGDIWENSEDFLIKKLKKNQYIIDGFMDIDDFNNEFGQNIEKKGFETIAGFLMYISGHIPKQGEKITYKNLTFHVIETKSRTIEKVKLVISHR